MGAKNRERRRAKQKARQQEQRRRQDRAAASGAAGSGAAGSGAAGSGASGFAENFGGGFRVPPAMVVAELIDEALHALYHKDEDAVLECVGALVEGPNRPGQPGTPAGRRVVDAALTTQLRLSATELWKRGWQPADVVRVARRDFGARHGRIVVDVLAAEIRQYTAETVDERWELQLREFGATVWWERDDEYLSALAQREELARPLLIRCVLEVLFIFNTCPEIQMLCPPPGKARRGSLGTAASTRTGRVDERQLDRVRALLAKAESTSFPEEAEAYTAKAQELMARHSIDYALLSLGAESRDEPVGRRVGIDNPYEAPKMLLLDAVASANRCRAIWSSKFGFATVLGFASDIDAVELLFTSLLVQATTAMVQAGTRRDVHGRSSTRSFRQSFLTSYAQRIRERLAEATRQATAQASRDIVGQPGADRLLPVLASREAEVRSKADDLFPELTAKSVAITNREGWASGRAAADRAQLAGRRALPGDG